MDNENSIDILNKQLSKSSFFSLVLQLIWILYFSISSFLLSYKGYPNGTFLSNLVVKAIISNLYIVVLPVLLKTYYLSTLETMKKEEGIFLKVLIKSLWSNLKKEKDVFKFFIMLTIVGILLSSFLIAIS